MAWTDDFETRALLVAGAQVLICLGLLVTGFSSFGLRFLLPGLAMVAVYFAGAWIALGSPWDWWNTAPRHPFQDRYVPPASWAQISTVVALATNYVALIAVARDRAGWALEQTYQRARGPAVPDDVQAWLSDRIGTEFFAETLLMHSVFLPLLCLGIVAVLGRS